MNMSVIRKYLWQNFGAVKIVCTLTCLYLLYDLFYQFFVLKPTSTQTSKQKFTSRNLPTLTLCHNEQFDLSNLEANGFNNHLSYRSGTKFFNDSHVMISWNGNKMKNVEELYNNLSYIKSPLDCPSDLVVWFVKKHEDVDGNFGKSFNRQLYCQATGSGIEDGDGKWDLEWEIGNQESGMGNEGVL